MESEVQDLRKEDPSTVYASDNANPQNVTGY
jgi:hypothetical protein